MCISERLKQVLDTKGISIKEFSELTGLSYRSAMNYLNEGRDPSVDALIKIYNALGISITWLITGNCEASSLENKNILSEQELNLINSYREMPDNLKSNFSEVFININYLNKSK